jgi:DNA-directed RNA polymerase subunit beta'
VRIVTSGDSEYLPGELLYYQKFQNMNQDLMAQSKRPASGRPILLGITKAALNTDSFLSASSFQHTINVLAQAAIEGKRDELFGLKENVILGKLIPAGTGYQHYHTVDENGDLVESIPQLASSSESIDLATGGNGANELGSATDELALSA